MADRIGVRIGLCLMLMSGTALSTLQAIAAEPAAVVIAKDDKDSDRTLDWNEVDAAASTRFDKLDKNSDGTLDGKEVKAVISPATFKAADANNDGTLSKTEYLALVKKRFSQADADKDGVISAAELRGTAGRRLRLLIE